MKIKTLASIALAAVLFAGCAAAGRKFNKIFEAVSAAGSKRDFAALARLSGSITDADLAPDRLRGYSAGSLKTLYKTLSYVVFYLPDEENHVLRQEAVFNEKVRRGTSEAEDVEHIFSAFYLARMFDKAAEIKSRFPVIVLADIPEIAAPGNTPSGNWLVYDVSDGGKKAELKALPLAEGSKVVMAMSPGCGVLESAAKAIFADPELGPIFRSSGIMLTRRSEPAGVEEVKKTYDFPEVYLVHKSRDFPGLDFMFSPRFYFLKDGKVMSDFRGWSSDDVRYSMGKLRKGLLSIGIKTGAKAE